MISESVYLLEHARDLTPSKTSMVKIIIDNGAHTIKVGVQKKLPRYVNGAYSLQH